MKQKWLLGVTAVVVVFIILFGLFKLGSHSGKSQASHTQTQVQKKQSTSSTSQKKYSKEEYAMMAIVDYNKQAGTLVAEKNINFYTQSDHFEAIDSNGPNPMKITVGQKQTKLADEDGKSHVYTILKLNQQLKKQQNKVDKLIQSGKANYQSSKKDESLSTSSSSSSADTQSSSVDVHNLTSTQLLAWVKDYGTQNEADYEKKNGTSSPDTESGEPDQFSVQNVDGYAEVWVLEEPSTKVVERYRVDENGDLQNQPWNVTDEWTTISTTYMGNYTFDN
ncbi:MAG: hypothetical protein DUD32_01455 [Lactobacillus sp.]|nr:MAG: hypothetical protein DUD32_01455 [Lactobacillus sp.]